MTPTPCSSSGATACRSASTPSVIHAGDPLTLARLRRDLEHPARDAARNAALARQARRAHAPRPARRRGAARHLIHPRGPLTPHPQAAAAAPRILPRHGAGRKAGPVVVVPARVASPPWSDSGHRGGMSYIDGPRSRGLRVLRPGFAERRGRADRAPRRALLRRPQPLPLRQRAPHDPAVPPRLLARRARGGRAARSCGSCSTRRSTATGARTRRPRATTSASTSARRRAPGIADHLHLHVVPRWNGDVNFMPVLADVRVMPQHLSETRAALAAAWPH